MLKALQHLTRRLAPLVLAAAAVLSALPAVAATITIDAPGCTAGGTLTLDAASKTVYCKGATAAVAGVLAVSGPDCPNGTALGWNSSPMMASCQPATGARAAASLRLNVALPDCLTGMVTWNASTRTLVCRAVDQRLNVDASTQTVYDALTDGLMIMRYMFGLRGYALTANALSPTATRTDPTLVANYLDGIRGSLDIDNNGVVDALTDGSLILRYMFGSRGDSLIANAIGNGALNANAASIESRMRSLTP